MPLYEYRCNQCAIVFDLLRPMAERQDDAPCPRCEGHATMPLMSVVAAAPAPRPSSQGLPATPPAPRAGGCCGGSCGCG